MKRISCKKMLFLLTFLSLCFSTFTVQAVDKFYEQSKGTVVKVQDVRPLEDVSIAYDSLNNLWALVGIDRGQVWVRIYNRTDIGSDGGIIYRATPILKRRLSRMKIGLSEEDEIFIHESQSRFPDTDIDDLFNITDPNINYTHRSPQIVYSESTGTFFVVWIQSSGEFGEQAVGMVFSLHPGMIEKWDEPRVLNCVRFINRGFYSTIPTIDNIDNTGRIVRIDIDTKSNSSYAIVAITINYEQTITEEGIRISRWGTELLNIAEIRLVPMVMDHEYEYHYNFNTNTYTSYFMWRTRVIPDLGRKTDSLLSVSASIFKMGFDPDCYKVALLDVIGVQRTWIGSVCEMKGKVFYIRIGHEDPMWNRIERAEDSPMWVVGHEETVNPPYTRVLNGTNPIIRLADINGSGNIEPIVMYTYDERVGGGIGAPKIRIIAPNSGRLLADIQPPRSPYIGLSERVAGTVDFSPQLLISRDSCILTYRGYVTGEDCGRQFGCIFNKYMPFDGSEVISTRGEIIAGWSTDIKRNKGLVYASGNLIGYWDTENMNTIIDARIRWSTLCAILDAYYID